MNGAEPADEALVIRIVKGRADPAEIAALTSVLLARAAALTAVCPGLQDQQPTATWRRPERTAQHRDPRGWRRGGSQAA
ncbi:acyl-CoA carboxylase epsilon subunit [Streptomyces sp. NPDC048389]|uniref:acyl-CoA carboxylase epsilon subunit n=1 Tax=Streptomyces sp. NPDC048389 TaxID=3154622 RepID=UPI0034522409